MPSLFFSSQQQQRKQRNWSLLALSFKLNVVPIILEAPVVQTLDSAIHRINRYPVDKYYNYGNQLRYPLDRVLSIG